MRRVGKVKCQVLKQQKAADSGELIDIKKWARAT